MFSLPDDRKSGVYTIDLERKSIFTKDDEANYFEIDEDGHVTTKLSTTSISN